MKESEIQKQILHYLRNIKRYDVWRSYVGPIIRSGVKSKNREMAGFPDITGFLLSKPHQMFCIEVKSDKGVISKDQHKWHKLLREHSVPVLIAKSLNEVIESMNQLEHDSPC